MTPREAFFRFLKPEYLYGAALAFAVLTVILVALIYFYLYLKKRNFRRVERINEQVNSWIGQVLMEKELPEIELSTELQTYLRKKRNREYVIDNLIKIRKNLTGAPADSIVELYEKLDLKRDSVERFRSFAWHRKARGIYELYMMDQQEELPDIYKYTNSDNEYIRMEAQTAIIGFWGFEGLTFLDTLEQPFHEWQQLKILEQLSTLDTVTIDNLPQWLTSSNEYVIEFALKLADIYQQMEVHDVVVQSLESHNEKLRYQAIKTLGRIARPRTAEILIRRYPLETYENKRKILKQLRQIGTPEHVAFLKATIAQEDDLLKLEAVRALAAIGDDILSQPHTGDAVLESIVKHVKYELSR